MMSPKRCYIILLRFQAVGFNNLKRVKIHVLRIKINKKNFWVKYV